MTEEKLEAEIKSILNVWVTATDDGHGGYAVEGKEEATEKLLALLRDPNPWRVCLLSVGASEEQTVIAWKHKPAEEGR